MKSAHQDSAIKLLDGMLHPGGLFLTQRLIDYCAFQPGARVIDIGCGAGNTVEYLQDIRRMDAVGIDSSEEALRQGKMRSPGLRLLKAQAESLPFAPASFEGVIAECSLSVMKYDGGVLSGINRVLVAGGKLAITDLYIKNDRSKAPASGSTEPNCLNGALTYSELTRMMEEYGFKILLWEDHSPCLKEFIARYIMEYGVLAHCWQRGAQEKRERKEKIGYFLLVAEKPASAGVLD
ncbi:MAG: class I SAM-dependent methyltransferase [Syntrophomonadaceae bacterium]|nr:class I SAM-dependent methyltransferase [Syntrophomonadaceae bacterium]